MSLLDLIASDINNHHPSDILFADTETTGMSRDREVIELGVVDLRGNILLNQRFLTYLPIHYKATEVHGITNSMLIRCPHPCSVAEQVREIFKDKIVIFYNKSFDVTGMENSFEGFSNQTRNIHCMLKAYREYNRTGLSNKLMDACRRHGVAIHDLNAHSAVDDALATQRLTLKLIQQNYQFSLPI